MIQLSFRHNSFVVLVHAPTQYTPRHKNCTLFRRMKSISMAWALWNSSVRHQATGQKATTYAAMQQHVGEPE